MPGHLPEAIPRQQLAGFPPASSDDPPIWECPPDACSGSRLFWRLLASFSTWRPRSRRANLATGESLSTIGFRAFITRVSRPARRTKPKPRSLALAQTIFRFCSTGFAKRSRPTPSQLTERPLTGFFPGSALRASGSRRHTAGADPPWHSQSSTNTRR